MGLNLDYVDIDFNGEETSSGTAKEYVGLDAIKSAFRNYILSDPGDILFYPSVGGIVTQILHKTMSENILRNLTVSIKRAIEEDFRGIQITTLQFLPDFEANVLELFISYSVGEQSQSISLYFDKSLEKQTKYEYTYIEYVGENLKNFCINKKSDQGSETLGLDNQLNLFRWGEFVFKNFSPTDPYFEEIYLICNAGVQ